MKLYERAALLDEILDSWREALGEDFTAYRNHCYRVLNFCLAFGAGGAETMDKVCVAAGFHDLGIWVNGTLDYLGPSRRLAREYLAVANRADWTAEIETMIELHHKLTKYRANADWLVEPFRRADWVDVTSGRRRFGLSPTAVSEVLVAFPNAGFHKRLVALTKQRFMRHPLSPLPMMRL